MRDATPPGSEPDARLTLKDGGWVLMIAMVLVLGIMSWAVYKALINPEMRLRGDGETVASYGFSLEPSLLPEAEIRTTGLPRDLVKALDDPRCVDLDGLREDLKAQRGKYLVSSDRVIGVVLNGEARAYPLQILNVHSVANDTVGGRPITITYDPLCDAAVVFERTVDDQVRLFRVSGLVHDSHMLVYDAVDPEHEDALESLWLPLQLRAVTGPAADAGLILTPVPATIARWDAWIAAHPDTTVMTRNPRLMKRYKGTDYSRYFQTDALQFPIDPLLEEGGRAPKNRVVVVRVGDETRVYDLPSIARAASTSGGTWSTDIAGTTITFSAVDDATAIITADTDDPWSSQIALWFAWYAQHPDSIVIDAE